MADSEHVAKLRSAIERVQKKYPGMDTAIYDEYLDGYIQHEAAFKARATAEDGTPLHPKIVEQRRQEHFLSFNKEFDAKHPRFAGSNDPADIARASANDTALRRLSTEMFGENIFTRAVKGVYDEEKGGLQMASITGGGIGAMVGILMGTFIAGAAGGGWLGTVAVIMLGLAGMSLGSQVGNNLVSPPPEYTPNKPAEPAKGEQKTQEKEVTTEEKTQALNRAKDAFLNGQKEMTDEAKAGYETLEKALSDTKAASKALDTLKAKFAADGNTTEEEKRVLDVYSSALKPLPTPAKPSAEQTNER